MVASAAVLDALKSLASDACGQLEEDHPAFVLWSETDTGSASDAGEALENFAAEAAFAAAARNALEARAGGSAGRFASVFPHLYDSPLFSWFAPSDQAAADLTAALDPLDAEPGELLGWLYQYAVPEEVRRRFGHVYTAAPIVRSMLDGLDFSGSKTLESRLIDPACGAGAFLIEAARRVISAAEEQNLTAAETCRAVQRVIHGIDLNPLGVLLTEAALALLLAPYLADLDPADELEPLHLYVSDTLRAGELRAEAHADIVEQIKRREGPYASGFDFVAANPPYAKLPSRLMTAEQLRYFSRTTYGHPNLYGLFLQVGTELLADGGRLAFINPTSFVSGLYFKRLRRFLTEELSLERFDSFEKRTGVFDGVLQEVVIMFATRSHAQAAEIELRAYHDSPEQTPRVIRVPSTSALLSGELDHIFFIAPDEIAHRLLDKMLRRGRPLAELNYEACTGTIVWNRVKDLIRDEPGGDALPLIWGNGIREFSFLGIGNRAGSATHVAIAGKTQSIVSRGDSLLVKRMTAKEERRRLVACRVPSHLADSADGYYAENHVNLVRPRGESGIELDAVLGLLNSALFDYVFRALNGNTQVSATELEMLPIATGPELAQIAEVARALANDPSDSRDRQRLDDLVADLYGLNEGERAALAGSAAVPALAAA